MGVLALLFALNFSANSQSIVGTWQGSGEPVEFFIWQGKITASTRRYVDRAEYPMNATIDYVYSFDPKTLQGNLTTFDSYYGCKLENGQATIRFIDANTIDMVFNRINFNVEKTYVGSSRPVEKPVFCNYGMGEFICGWKWVEPLPSQIKCNINFRQPIHVELKRIK